MAIAAVRVQVPLRVLKTADNRSIVSRFYFKDRYFMKIRKVLASDLDAVMEIVDAARGIMRASGNMLQWTGGYPDKTVMTADIRRGVCYGCEDDGKLSAVFSMIPGPDPTYTDIYGGAWLNEEPYLVVHRIASLPECHGVMDAVLNFCYRHYDNIRIDTHRDNSIMRHCLQKAGFAYCGIIYLANGDERLAFHRATTLP